MDSRPTVYIFHGDDPFGIERALAGLIGRMGDPAMVEMNLSRFDGRDTSDDEIRSAAYALPFLSERRVVILTHPLARLKSEPARERFREMLDGLPESTALVMLFDDVIERGDWAQLKRDHWLKRWVDGAGGRAYYQEFHLPPLSRMPEWIRKEARERGGSFSPEGAATLAEHIGNDTRIAALEIDKLLTYTGGQRPVEAQDVAELTASNQQAGVFQMTDALSDGNATLALNLLHRLMEEEDEYALFGMIVRQFRLLLTARELLDQGRGIEDFTRGLAHNKYVAEKTMKQAHRYRLSRLQEIYRSLLEMDENAKTGKCTLPIALEALVVDLAR